MYEKACGSMRRYWILLLAMSCHEILANLKVLLDIPVLERPFFKEKIWPRCTEAKVEHY
jgi:hypothetical protein